jgi:S-adenosylmethionine:tRNA ribosyltransferase-isomerase
VTSPDARVLVFGNGTMQAFRMGELPQLLDRGDVLVVNDAATLPASLRARTAIGAPVELRLLGLRGTDSRDWTAVLFGDGDYHTPTEHRLPPPELGPGDSIRFSDAFAATVIAVSPISKRLIDVRFACAEHQLWSLLYAHGRPVQYAHTSGPYELWDVQTPYASRPWAVEMPSAGYHLGLSVLRDLEQRGVMVKFLTHAAGLSATGDATLDERLPLAERFEIPQETVDAVNLARRSGHRVVAAGTTVLRALEGCAVSHAGQLVAGPGVTDLRIGPEFRLKIADALLTGIHERGSSHFRLLRALADQNLLDDAYRYAEELGLRGHELGDVSLVWASRSPDASPPAAG